MWDLPSASALKSGKGRHVNYVSSSSVPSPACSLTGPPVQLCAVSVLMATVQHQASAPVTLDGRERTAVMVRQIQHCLPLEYESVTPHSNM